ncbi:MAG: hypothetical protein AMXMBFR16_10790 [Candidatus Uhrbacteria bacterium]
MDEALISSRRWLKNMPPDEQAACSALRKQKIRDRSRSYAMRPEEQEKRRQRANKRRASKTADELRDLHLRKAYGYSMEQYTEQYAKQEGRCMICQQWFEKLAVDHCHKTMRIRGLLCQTCNNGLGCFKDSVEMMENAICYLKGGLNALRDSS